MTSQIDKTPNLWKEKEAIMSTQNITPVKSIKRLKSPKKNQDCKKSANEMRIEDVFLNSEYFKYQSGNISSLSFCSGDNGENQWTVDSKFEIPFRRKSVRFASNQNDTIKSDTAVLEKEKVAKQWQKKLKKQSCSIKDDSEEKLLEGILSEKGNIDRDLISLITDQMFLAERELQITRTHLIETIGKLNERDLEILQLHEKIKNLQKINRTESLKGGKKNQGDDASASSKTSEDYQRLVKASEKLKKQVKDMEEFLNDYGLVWVGEKENRKPDFDKIIKNFQRLNAVAAQPKIIQTTTGAKFELPREISVVLYSNGLLLRNSEFREYSLMSTSLFLQDVEDGYFPSELQSEFPEGVPFEVTDKRNEYYQVNGKIPVFQGRGNRLGSTFEGKPSPVVVLEPLKQNRNYDYCSNLEYTDSLSIKKIHKKRSRNLSAQREKIPSALQFLSESGQKIETEYPEKERGNSSTQLKVKIRFGKEKTELFVLQFPMNEKMFEFQTALQKVLCERYHNEYISFGDTNKPPTDFEIHVYGRNPFRLSDHLNQYPIECGLVNNCVLNVTEI